MDIIRCRMHFKAHTCPPDNSQYTSDPIASIASIAYIGQFYIVVYTIHLVSVIDGKYVSNISEMNIGFISYSLVSAKLLFISFHPSWRTLFHECRSDNLPGHPRAKRQASFVMEDGYLHASTLKSLMASCNVR